jgi:hypothetical protein
MEKFLERPTLCLLLPGRRRHSKHHAFLSTTRFPRFVKGERFSASHVLDAPAEFIREVLVLYLRAKDFSLMW